MKYKIVFLPEAKSDVKEIREYLSQYYESTVKNFFALLKKRTKNLKLNPYICQPYEERPSYRRLVIGDYLVFYKVDDEKKLIQIHRISHCRRDIGRYL